MLANGTRVVILPTDSYNNTFVGMRGTVIRYNYCNKLYDVNFGGSIYNFYESELSVVPKGLAKYNEYKRYVKNNLNNIFGLSLKPKRIIFSGPKTIVIWTDGTKTIVSCMEGDTYDPYAGFCAAVTKKLFGSTSQVKKVIGEYTQGENK